MRTIPRTTRPDLDAISRPPAWMARGLCGQTDPELFYPDDGRTQDAKRAKQLCAGCPVRTECRDHALAADEEFGIWGGLSEWERRHLRGTPGPREHVHAAAVRVLVRKFTDPEIAVRLGCSVRTVRYVRGQVGVPAWWTVNRKAGVV